MLFEKILEMSLVSCYVIAVVLVIRLLLNKCERKYSFLLWFVVFLNLILPVSIEGPFSLIPERIAEGTLVQEGYYGERVPEADWEQYTGNGLGTSTTGTVGDSIAVNDTVASSTSENPVAMNSTAGNNLLNKEQSYWEYAGSLNDDKVAEAGVYEEVSGMVAGEADASVDDVHHPAIQPQQPVTQKLQATAAGEINIPMTIAGFVWLAGLAVIWGISFCKGVLLNRQLKKSREGQKISPEGVVCAEDISAPFLWGILKPVIYLPASIEEEERTYIIAHESYHKKRFDHITKLMVFVIVTIHWFNPLVWLSYALFVRDMEISCDEAVLAHTGKDIKKQYASSLLKYAAKQNGFVLAPLTFGEPSLKSRIQNVLGYKKRGMVVTIAAVCVVMLTACGLIVRPSTEEGQTQTGGEQNTTVPGEPTAEPETTKAPEVTQAPDATTSPYSVYFQDILQANYEEQGGKYLTIESVKESAKYSYVESVADYKEPEAAYSAKSDFSLENGGICGIDWIKLSSDLTLENLTFDMSRELEEANLEDGFVHGVFYDREEDRVYVIISNHTGTPSATWMICFRPKNPTDYEIYDYEYSSWFGECYYADGTIYLHGGCDDTPYVIDVETKEGRLCTAEYTAARAATYEMSAEYARTHESALYVYWMKGVAKWEDVDIFSGLLMEAMDFFPGVADIYVASRAGEVLETMVVNRETGEVTIMKGLGSNPAVRPLTQEQLDWFNESFFNQGYIGEEANIYEGIRNQFLTHEYVRPEDINIAEVFYNGAGEELTEDDKLCLSGEARWKLPLYTGDMVLLSEEEHAAVAEIDVDVSKTSWDTMDSILEMHTGLALGETNRWGMDELYFNKRDCVFYHFHGDTNALFVQVRSGHYNADGTITLYYVRSGSQNWIEEATEVFAVVLQRVGDSYLFVANASLETLQSQQGLKQQEETVTDEYPVYWKEVLNFHKRQAPSSEYVAFEEENSLCKNAEGKAYLPLEVLASEGYRYQVDALELGNGTVLKNLTFDFQKKMQEADCERLWLYGAHYDENERMIYLLFNLLREEGGILLLTFGEEAPENYQLTVYEGIEVPMGGSSLLGNSIFLDAGIPENIPWELNLGTGEMHFCEQEYEDAVYWSQRYCAQYRLKTGISLEFGWFHALGYVEDVEIYAGYLEEEEASTAATIYTAYREGACLGALVIDEYTGEIYLSTEKQEQTSRYKLTAVDHEDYNAVFENNGYQYHFKLDMDTAKLFPVFGEEIERSNSTGKWTVTPVYASNGVKEELLGELRGFTLDITSNALVEPKYASGDRFYGIIGEVTEDSLTIQPVEVIDRDTYIEYQMDVVKESVTYKLAEDVEYIMLDANFRGAHAAYERFHEHMSRTSDKVCCFVVKDGVVLQIWEPYIP